MATILKTLGSHPDLGDFSADILDNGSANLCVDEFMNYGPDELQCLIDALQEVKAELLETI